MADDSTLIVAARAGDQRAFAALYRDHHRRALHEARKVVRNSSDAEDCVSAAFASTFQAIRKGGGPTEAFRPYLLTAVRNSALQLVRLKRYGSEVATEEIEPPAHVDLYEIGADPAVRNAFANLPERWREVLWKTEIEGRPPRELAVELAMSANSVAALAKRARDGFRQAYLTEAVGPEPHPWAMERLDLYREGRSTRGRATSWSCTSRTARSARTRWRRCRSRRRASVSSCWRPAPRHPSWAPGRPARRAPPSSAGCATCVPVRGTSGPRRRRSPQPRWRWSARLLVVVISARSDDPRAAATTTSSSDASVTAVVTVERPSELGPVRSVTPSLTPAAAQLTVAPTSTVVDSTITVDDVSTTLVDDGSPTIRATTTAPRRTTTASRRPIVVPTAPPVTDTEPTTPAVSPSPGPTEAPSTDATSAPTTPAPPAPTIAPTTAEPTITLAPSTEAPTTTAAPSTSQPQYGGTLSLSRGRPSYTVTVEATAPDGLPAGTTISFSFTSTSDWSVQFTGSVNCSPAPGGLAGGPGDVGSTSCSSPALGQGSSAIVRFTTSGDVLPDVRIVAQRPGGQPATACDPPSC